jgi:hypothetical protein
MLHKRLHVELPICTEALQPDAMRFSLVSAPAGYSTIHECTQNCFLEEAANKFMSSNRSGLPEFQN